MNDTQGKDRRGENGLALIVGSVLGMILGGGLVAGISGWLLYAEANAASVNATMPSPVYTNGAANSAPTSVSAPVAGSSYGDTVQYSTSPASGYGSPYSAASSYEESSEAAVGEVDTTAEMVDPETVNAESSAEKRMPKVSEKGVPAESWHD